MTARRMLDRPGAGWAWYSASVTRSPIRSRALAFAGAFPNGEVGQEMIRGGAVPVPFAWAGQGFKQEPLVQPLARGHA